MINDFNENGYIHFKKIINIEQAMNSIRDNKVNYYEMKDFIENTMLSNVKEIMKFESMIYIKWWVCLRNMAGEIAVE